MRLLPRLLALLLLPLALSAAPPASPAGGTFQDGDRWVAVGDSITHNGLYHAWVRAYYATRFPERDIAFANAGISGDTAAGGLRRHDWDIAPKAATVATVMFGMNDVTRSLYTDTEPSADTLRRRADALERYRQNITALVARLRADGARVVLVTPSPFDQTVALDSPAQVGVNDALALCADHLRALAAADPSLGLIDLHGPITALNLRGQQTDPAFTLSGRDRIHPGAVGHLIMAWLVLKAQGAPAEVSRVELDAATLRTTAANAEVSALAGDAATGLTFTVAARALPWPIDAAALPALDLAPVVTDLNQEILRVTGLAPGRHRLDIDGQAIRAYSAEELAAGVNLALETNTPQARQAAAVLDLVKRHRSLEASGLRTIAQIEHGLLKDLPRPISREDAAPRIAAKLDELRTTEGRQNAYWIRTYESYLKVKPDEAATRVELDRLAAEIRETARPLPRSYRLTRE